MIKVIISQGAELSGAARKALNEAISGEASLETNWETIEIPPEDSRDNILLDNILEKHFSDSEFDEVFVSDSTPLHIVVRLSWAAGAWNIANTFLWNDNVEVDNIKIKDVYTLCIENGHPFII